ncbi:carboxylesterase/lipase family protein [Lichenicoccus sp.]|uniref:carboxylesterase/lipase family protein n=1 Tax=Lichenicoccus sp. TaxID=2781899 RepID=UPI003D0D7778
MPENIIVEIGSGQLRGQLLDGVAAFRGIPYGESVSGCRRWQRCRPVPPWKGVRNALEFGPRAIQPESRDMGVTSSQLEALMLEGSPPDDRWRQQSEECLTLSVWTPEPHGSRRLAVMFWCHGGKYFGETPPVWWFDGGNLARSGDVVVVTVRHRVGALGFLHLADLPGGSAYEDASNIGMLDLVDALKWVRQNIAQFGGDPENVTVFGESGGALKVSVLLRMPDARGLFHKAIVQSGSQMVALSRDEGTGNARALLAELGLGPDDVPALIAIPPEDLVRAQVRLVPNLWRRSRDVRSAEFEPIIDGRTLPLDSFGPAAWPVSDDVPLLVGTCANETTFLLSSLSEVFEMGEAQMRGMIAGMFGDQADQVLNTYLANRPGARPSEILFAITGDFIFRRRAIRMAELKAGQHGAPVYMYVLEFRTDVHGGVYGTPHILDLPLVFAHPDHPILGSDPARFVVSRQMSGAWTAFARTGNPNIDLLPHWPAYTTTDRATMHFEEHARLVLDPRSSERILW